jgi:hypothetical protein
MVTMGMIMMMRGEEFFEEIDSKKSDDKCIQGKGRIFERLWQYVYQRNREHGASANSDEHVEELFWYFLCELDNEPSGGYDYEDRYNKEMHK